MANLLEFIIDFNKKTVEQNFSFLNETSKQTGRMMESFFDYAPQIPEDSKKVLRNFYRNSNDGLDSIKKTVEATLSVDISTTDTSVQMLKVFEESIQDAFVLASKIQEQNQEFVSHVTSDLPREGKQIVEFISESLNNNIEAFKDVINKNFALANKIIEENQK